MRFRSRFGSRSRTLYLRLPRRLRRRLIDQPLWQWTSDVDRGPEPWVSDPRWRFWLGWEPVVGDWASMIFVVESVVQSDVGGRALRRGAGVADVCQTAVGISRVVAGIVCLRLVVDCFWRLILSALGWR